MSGAELTDAERDNVEADVYARCMVDLAKEHPRAEGIHGKTDTLIGGVQTLSIVLGPSAAYHAKAGPEIKRPRAHLLAQIVSALAHDVGGCDCRGGMVCPAASEVVARCKSEIDTRLAAATVIKSISVFAKP